MYVSIDLGGTNTRVASSTDLNSLHKTVKFKTCSNLDDQILKVSNAIKEVAEKRIDGICVGAPGIVNTKKNKFEQIVNITYLSNLNVTELVTPELRDNNFIVVNDAALAGLGEAIHGAGKNFETVAYITISTGVGGIRISNKKLDLTQRFSEPGHHIIDIGGVADTKVKLYGTLEAYISGEAFERNYGVPPTNCDDKSIWEDYGEKFSKGLVNICAFWAPECVVVGGGISNKFELFADSVENNFKAQDFFSMPVLKKAELGDNSGLYGGFALIKQIIS